MPSLKIHRQYQSGIEKIIALDNSVFEAILTALRKTVPALPLDDLVRNVESEVENTNHDDLVNILESIIPIYALKKTYAWTVEELADELIAAVDEFEELSNLSTEEKERFCEKLNDLLMPNSFLESASKAKDVLKVYLLPSGIPADDFPIKSKVELEAEFKKFAEEWRVETGMLSLVTQKSMHQAYQRIIGMGQPVIPLILRDLEQKPDHWFWALRAITGDNPVKPEQRGRMKQMALAWIQWGKEHGYEW